ncbi:hypothetical protein LR48_Vigan01g243000 [Vigna angularis]|uniref:Uncharacterized protein n=1 Tax=Phaseolus angularis TaxID=3914 RepID=A0A0L9TRT2_PHAAN|nr:hypothetical protein LR48_Vigan01g243000 [Vigna angularis]
MSRGVEQDNKYLIFLLLPQPHVTAGSHFHHHCFTSTVVLRDVVEFIICLLLTILGYIPGIIYALYAIIFVDRDQYFDEYRRPLYSQY